MVAVTFVSVQGGPQTLDIPEGVSLMQGGVQGGIDGIEAECGGALACATCHVHIDAAWVSRLDPPAQIEREMLEFAIDPDERSRLSCQVTVRRSLDGLIVHLPPRQR